MPTYGRHSGRGTATAYPVACAVCGSVWPRSEMHADGSGQLVCPDDWPARDAVTLDRLNSRVRPLRQKGPSDGLTSTSITNPKTILGDGLHGWFRMEEVEIVRNAGRLRFLRNLNATGDLRPELRQIDGWSPQAIAGGPGIVNGDGFWRMNTASASFTAMPAGRPYFWVVAALDAAQSGTNTAFTAVITGPDVCVLYASAGKFRLVIGNSDDIEGPAIDALPHLFEFGFTENAAARFVVDGVEYAGGETAASADEVTRLSIGDWHGSHGEMVSAYSVPSAVRLGEMRAYLRGRYPDLPSS